MNRINRTPRRRLSLGAPITAVCCLLSMIVVAGELGAQCGIREIEKLRADDGAARQRLGQSVTLDGATAVVGAHRDDPAGPSSGSAYVFQDDGRSWQQVAKLIADDAATGDEFGAAVALDGDILVVGAPLDDNGGGEDAGAAYVYRNSGGLWTLEQKLQASNATPQDWFGSALAISGNVILVGAPFAAGDLFNTGLAYVYQFEGAAWVEKQILAPEPGGGEFRFGHAVAAAGNILAVGAPSDQLEGAVYAFHHVGSSWILQQRITQGGIQVDDEFGAAVSLDGARMLVGAPGQNGVAPHSGAAHLFAYDGSLWQWQRAFWAPGSESLDRVGDAVSLAADLVLLGAPFADRDGEDSGAAYVYQNLGSPVGPDDWVFTSRLSLSDGAAGDRLGASVASSSGIALLGAAGADDVAFLSGAAGLFDAVQGLELTVDPVAVDPWDVVTIASSYGPPGNPALLAVVELNGTPLFLPIATGEFDAHSRWILDVLIYPGLSGVTVVTQSFALLYCGSVAASNPVTVTFN